MSIEDYHASHDDGIDYTCSVCTVGAVMAQVEDLSRDDALSTLAAAAANVWRMSTRETIEDGPIYAAILTAIDGQRRNA